ncbi:MAG: hypothetical protein JW838_08750 [Spirochaetes bacterium]|nr:hypothetical protein [Spirochaetota bacterium]
MILDALLYLGPDHHEVTLNYFNGTDWDSAYEVGARYGEIIKSLEPGYEFLIDAYLEDISSVDGYAAVMARVAEFKPDIPEEYRDEIEGLASRFSPGAGNVTGDGRLSVDEVYAFNLIPDIIVMTPACTALSVHDGFSSTGSPLVGRVLDWYGGTARNYLAPLQAAVTIWVPPPRRSICLIGYLGFLGVITAINNRDVFGAIIDSPLTPGYTAVDKRSFAFDLRYAMENFEMKYEMADYMKDPARDYAFNHLIFLADATDALLVENDVKKPYRATRTPLSPLNPLVTWEYPDALGAVNSFLLVESTDNHTVYSVNTARWQSLRTLLSTLGVDGVITPGEFELILGFDNGDGPDSMATGDIYNYYPPSKWGTQQIVIFEPAAGALRVFFCPRSGVLPGDPVFTDIPYPF